jgi:hypothetical protein
MKFEQLLERKNQNLQQHIKQQAQAQAQATLKQQSLAQFQTTHAHVQAARKMTIQDSMQGPGLKHIQQMTQQELLTVEGQPMVRTDAYTIADNRAINLEMQGTKLTNLTEDDWLFDLWDPTLTDGEEQSLKFGDRIY